MKTPEDEAFDELARKQGAWGGGFQAKRQMAMDKINSDFDEEYKKMHEDRIKYGTAWSQDGKRIDPMSVYKEPVDIASIIACREMLDAQPVPAQEPEREALKLALITLEGWDNHDKWVWPETALEQAKRNTKEAITAIKEALAQPAQGDA